MPPTLEFFFSIFSDFFLDPFWPYLAILDNFGQFFGPGKNRSKVTSKNSGTLTGGTNDSHLGRPETRPDGPGFSRDSVFRTEDPEQTLPGQFRPIFCPRGFDPAPLAQGPGEASPCA